MQKTLSKLYKTLVYDNEVSLAVLDTTALVQEAIYRHGLSPVAAAALGRTLTVSAYLCSWLKEEQSSLSVTIDGGGVGGKIGVCGDGALNMRGYLEHPHVQLPPRADGKLDVGACVGRAGTITVIRDDGSGLPFVGTCDLVSGEIGEDFSAYFLYSEQRPTAVAVGVKIAENMCVGAGAVILQPLPYASEESLARAERDIARFSAVSTLIAEHGAEWILQEKFGAKEYDMRPVRFACHCSRERAARAVVSLGREEALATLQERGNLSVHCHYCNTDYTFDGADIDKLFDTARFKEET